MILWKVDRLASGLGNNQVSQKEEFKYTLAFSLLSTLVLGLAAIGADAVPAWLMATDLVIMLAINLVIGYMIHAFYFIYLARWMAAAGNVGRHSSA